MRQLPAFLTEDQFADLWRDYFIENPPQENDHITMYIHYPWCKSVCKYCVFGEYYQHQHQDIISRYEQITPRAIEKVCKVLDEFGIVPNELYFGGGTASLWSADPLMAIQKVIPMYNQIQCKQCEIHPDDLSNDLISFYHHILDFNRISIGIQTFDEKSLRAQNRIPGNKAVIYDAIRLCQEFGIFVNIDLVAMFNGDDESNWSIFIEDLNYTANILKPDSIYVSPNYKSDDYYGISIKFRQILQDFLKSNHQYYIDKPEALSLDYKDIIRYRDIPYTLKKKYPGYRDLTVHQFTQEIENEIIIGIGGFENSNALSKTPNGIFARSKYLPMDREFLFEAYHHQQHINQEVSDEDLYKQTVHIGNYTIKPPKKRD